jgi:hypothetical protein
MSKKDDSFQIPYNNLETAHLEDMRSDLHKSEAQTRKRINRLDAAISHLYKVVAPLRRELDILERKRLGIEKLLFERYGKVQKVASDQSGGRTLNHPMRRKSDREQIQKAASIISKLSPEELQALLDKSNK